MVVCRGTAHNGLDCGSHGLGFPNTGQSAVGAHHQDAVVIGAIEQLDQRVFRTQVNSFNSSDLHGSSPRVRRGDDKALPRPL